MGLRRSALRRFAQREAADAPGTAPRFTEVDTMASPECDGDQCHHEQTTVLAIGNGQDLDVVKLSTYAYPTTRSWR